MEFLKIALLALGSVTVLFILSRLMGYKQIRELSFFDYVVGITIGSVAAEMAMHVDLVWWKGVTVMVIYALAEMLLSFLSQKSIGLRRIISGVPIVIIEKGTINKAALKKAGLELDELSAAAREAGYFNLADLDYAIMETNGTISFLPAPLQRPLNPKDFNFAPEREGLCVTLVSDGRLLTDNLSKAGVSAEEIMNILEKNGRKTEDILLATINEAGRIDVFEKQD